MCISNGYASANMPQWKPCTFQLKLVKMTKIAITIVLLDTSGNDTLSLNLAILAWADDE